MTRMKRRREPAAGIGRGGQVKRSAVPVKTSQGFRKPEVDMDARSRLVVVSLMGGLLVMFLLIGILAPDPSAPSERAGGSTVLWRLLFLLAPLGIMYGLLWGEKLLGFMKRSRESARP